MNQITINIKALRITTLLLLLTTICIAQETFNLNTHEMQRARLYAKSSINDTTGLQGFGESSNLAKKYDLNFSQTGVYLKIDTSEKILLDNIINAHKLYLVNKSDSTLKLDAMDSRLSIVAEVLHRKKWKPIEYLPSSWCGNSYHQVYLKKDEYWEFVIPVYEGEIKTKLRYRLAYSNGFIYSNEINASFNLSQTTRVGKYKSKGLMDPYDE